MAILCDAVTATGASAAEVR